MVLDERDRYSVPLGYNEGVEGIISVSSGSNLTLDIYDRDGDLYSRPLAKLAIAKDFYLKKAHNYKYQQVN